MRHVPALAAMLLALNGLSIAGAQEHRLVRAYAGADGAAHLVGSSGQEISVGKAKDQVAIADPKLSADHRVAGWLVEEANGGATYPIPIRLALYRDRSLRIVSDGQMIYDWCFASRGDRAAISTGVVHGATSRHLDLFDVRTGRRLAEWTGALGARTPAWADCLKR